MVEQAAVVMLSTPAIAARGRLPTLLRDPGFQTADGDEGALRGAGLLLRHRPASRAGTNHTAGSPPSADATTRTPPGAGSIRKCQPRYRSRTRQPPGMAS